MNVMQKTMQAVVSVTLFVTLSRRSHLRMEAK